MLTLSALSFYDKVVAGSASDAILPRSTEECRRVFRYREFESRMPSEDRLLVAILFLLYRLGSPARTRIALSC